MDIVAQADPSLHFIVHARKAWLSGLDPKQNRNIPPLHYDYVIKISKERPNLRFTINGGFNDINLITQMLEDFSGDIMIGRGIYEDPLFVYDILAGTAFLVIFSIRFIPFLALDPSIVSGKSKTQFRSEIIKEYCAYVENVDLPKSFLLPVITPLRDLFSGEPFNTAYRRDMAQRLNALSVRPADGIALARVLVEILSSVQLTSCGPFQDSSTTS